ncbi:MAG: ATP-grasp domain-containing protein [Clostridiales Family XIII bacterium]|jgi:D-aspartate ligase|nr:ATP-grasp domain-containing protein [Clostridiales Family XIII bacterium]
MKRPVSGADFIPLLFAGDINVYSMARAFHEQYGVKSRVFGKALSGPCSGSGIIDYTCNENADRQDIFLELVDGFARRHSGQKVLLIGCGDSYVRRVSANLGSYPENVTAPCVSAGLMDTLVHKEKFYALCGKSGVDYPDTFVHRREAGDTFRPPFEGPFIIKPSDSVAYWENPFPGQKKVFKTDSAEETEGVLKRIYESGYDDSVIIQNFIPGDDTYMRVLTCYSDRNGAVKLVCLGHVLLEEHTPHGIGNHAVIITEHNKALEDRLKSFLESLSYTGFSNFDVKYDRRDGKYKVFEINARQGRSNYYVTGAGENLAKYVVEDCIYGNSPEPKTVTERSLWMVVPKKVAFSYVGPPEYKEEMRKLIAAGRCVNPLLYPPDGGLKRRLRLEKSLLSHYLKFRKYYGKNRSG